MLRTILAIAAIGLCVIAQGAGFGVPPAGTQGWGDLQNQLQQRDNDVQLQRAQIQAINAWTACMKATNDAGKCGPAPQYQGRQVDYGCVEQRLRQPDYSYPRNDYARWAGALNACSH